MKEMVKKIACNKKFKHYCSNVLKMYSNGSITMPI